MPRPKHHKPAKPIGKRSTETKETRKRVLIICEGTKTEPNYFEAMRIDLKISGEVEVEGTGRNTLDLVNYATSRKGADFDQIWCVFDKDDFPSNNFNNAVQKARREKVEVAYSNECFELWYVLHYKDHTTAHKRDYYCNELSKQLKVRYEKGSSGMYHTLKDKQKFAIRRAEALVQDHEDKTPARANPSTTVHLLVLRLQEIAKEQELN